MRQTDPFVPSFVAREWWIKVWILYIFYTKWHGDNTTKTTRTQEAKKWLCKYGKIHTLASKVHSVFLLQESSRIQRTNKNNARKRAHKADIWVCINLFRNSYMYFTIYIIMFCHLFITSKQQNTWEVSRMKHLFRQNLLLWILEFWFIFCSRWKEFYKSVVTGRSRIRIQWTK